MACGTIRGWAANKNYYYIDFVCIQTSPHCGTNQECGSNWVNTVRWFIGSSKYLKISPKVITIKKAVSRCFVCYVVLKLSNSCYKFVSFNV